ncbi:MAG: FAD-dependent oxidoreductase [Limisphaerales bacterium]
MMENQARTNPLAQPGNLGPLLLDHRLIMGSMHLGIEGERSALPRLREFYMARLRGGAALIIMGGAAVTFVGGGDHVYCLAREPDQEDLRHLADAIRTAGGRLALQLFHAGRYARSSEIGQQPVAPSAIASRFTKEEPRAMSRDEIEATRDAFISSAAFAMKAGFAAVEIMASEGYLLNQFISPLTNRREDSYGGDLDGRMRLTLEIIRGAREILRSSQTALIVRMSGDDLMPDSTTRSETLTLARAIKAAGADALNIGIGWHESKVPTVASIVAPGAFANVAGDIRAAAAIPVLAANRIHTADTAKEILERGQADFIASARPWLADPEWGRKVLENERRALNRCIACNQACLDRTLSVPPRPVGCLVNPRAGREIEFPPFRSSSGRAIAVIGGGMAGLAAAKTGAERGLRVILFEKAPKLGGQFRLAAVVPAKQCFLDTIGYYEEMLRRFGGEIRLGIEPQLEELRAYDNIVVATGVTPVEPDAMPGWRLPHVCSYPDLLSGQVAIGQQVVVIGAGGIGCDVAHFLGDTAARNERRQIHLVSRSGRLARGVGPTTRWVLLAELRRLGVTVHSNRTVEEILPGRVRLRGPEGIDEIAADQVVLCLGQRPCNAWAERLQKAKIAFALVGGASDARRINAVRAITEAFECVTKL